MSWFFSEKKPLHLFSTLSCVAGGACYGLSVFPWMAMFSELSPMYSNRRWKRTGHPRFVLGSSNGSKKELSVDAEGLLKHKNSGRNISFGEVVIRWGAWPLKIGDALIHNSNCGSSTYYVARHIWGNNYWLDNGETVTLATPLKNFCTGGGDKKKTNTLTLNFQKGSGQVLTNIMIWIKSCNFKWNGTNNLKVTGEGLSMECKGNVDTQGSQEETVTLTLGSDSYKS